MTQGTAGIPVSRFRRIATVSGLALAWGAICAASAAIGLWREDELGTARAATIIAVFFAGAFLALALVAVFGLFRLFRRRRSVHFAFIVAGLLALTVLLTASLFTVPQYAYYTQWHEEVLTLHWIEQFAFTVVGAFYQFAVMALPFYFPLAFVGLFAIAWALVAKTR